MRAVLLFTLFFSLTLSVCAQQFKWEAALTDSVNKEGFYNVILTPAITAKMHDDLSDLRVYNEKGEEIPYVLKSESPYFAQEMFIEYPIVSKQIDEGCCTQLIIRNPGKRKINNICLVLKNSDAVKLSRMAGSDDMKQWYGLKRFYVFRNNYSDNDVNAINYINFPMVDYEYLKIDVIDWWGYPINIQKAGYYESYLQEGKYIDVPAPEFIQSDSLKTKKSWIKIDYADSFRVHKIRFNFEGPRFYLRKAVLMRKITGPKNYIHWEQIDEITLSSIAHNELDLTGFRGQEVYLVVNNDDNKPLKLLSVESTQLTQYLKTYLEPGHQYTMKYGDDSTLVSPVYDLRYFTDSIPTLLPELRITSVKALPQVKAAAKAARVLSWYEDKIWIWTALALVMALLGFMSVKMLREMKK